MKKKQKNDALFMGIFYACIVAINVVFLFLKDYLPKVTLNENNEYLDKWMFDGFQGSIELLPVNILLIVLSIVLIAGFVIKKKEKIPLIIGAIIISVLVVFFPVYGTHRSGGIAGVSENKSCSAIICY